MFTRKIAKNLDKLCRFFTAHNLVNSTHLRHSTSIAKLSTMGSIENDQFIDFTTGTHFSLQMHAMCDGKIPVSKFRSSATGLTVILANVPGPIVNGFICLATEAHDDDGLPHTLEHLVFLGSEDYPYKGVLDQFANRTLASGTNAWTETDHTCYTMTHAGESGFLTLLPIYMDHILYPTITESGYVTEVHNVDGAGQDGGIVYCEMQARENTGESRTHLALLRAMYPGHCGYKSETGGMLQNLRESTSHDKVKNYHKEFYRPENCCIIICGMVCSDHVFKSLQGLEKKIMEKGARSEFTRPWQNPVPPLTETVRETVRFPSEDEDYGMTHIGFRGPPSKDIYEVLCVSILTDYLDTSAIAPVQRDMVEIDEPYAGSADFNIIENAVSTVYVSFENTDMEKQKEIEETFMSILEKIASGEEELDMDRMSSVIHRRKLDTLSSLEYEPTDSVAFYTIGHFLYGDDANDLHGRLNTVQFCKRMQEEKSEFWIELLKKTFIGVPRVVITGVPSVDLGAEMGKEEEERIQKQQEELGQDGMEACKRKLESAEEENAKPPPETVHRSITPPDVGTIDLHTINPSSNINKSSDSNSLFPLSGMPFPFMLDDLTTNFVQINVLVDTSAVPQALKDYMPLFCDMLTESALKRENGEIVPYEEMVAYIERTTVACSAGLGVPGTTNFTCGSVAQLFDLCVRVEAAKYNEGVALTSDLLHRVHFTTKRVRVAAKKLLSETASAKRSGSKVIKAALRQMCYTQDSNLRVMNVLSQETFLKDLINQLKKTPESVLASLNELKSALTTPGRLSVHLALDVTQLSEAEVNLTQPWEGFLVGLSETSPSPITPPAIPPTHSLRRPIDSETPRAVIVGMKEEESSYLIQCVPCVDDHNHPDLPGLMVLLQYLSQCEGPMWKRIRGGGLSYGYSLTVNPESGFLFLHLTKATHIHDPYREAQAIVQEFSVSSSFTDLELESAKSSLVFELVEEQKTKLKASEQSLLTYFQGIPRDYHRDMLRRVWAVTPDDLTHALHTHLVPLFDPALARTVVCCNPTKVKATVELFQEHHGLALTELAVDDKAFARLGGSQPLTGDKSEKPCDTQEVTMTEVA